MLYIYEGFECLSTLCKYMYKLRTMFAIAVLCIYTAVLHMEEWI